MKDKTRIIWPRKHNIFGVSVSATAYDKLLDTIIQATKQGIPAIVE